MLDLMRVEIFKECAVLSDNIMLIRRVIVLLTVVERVRHRVMILRDCSVVTVTIIEMGRVRVVNRNIILDAFPVAIVTVFRWDVRMLVVVL